MQVNQKQFQRNPAVNNLKQYPLKRQDNYKSVQEQYLDEFDQLPKSQQISYVYMVQHKFTVPYDKWSYEQIQSSSNEMRSMLKQLSGKLDEKIHKYYGLMGQKHKSQPKDLKQVIQQLEAQIAASKKLLLSQQDQIRQIELVDKEMASSKRVEKQAERLRQYFEIKKNMLVVEKDTRFNRGEINKFGDYLARDLDVDKYYFRLNKIKEDFQYAMLKDKQTHKILTNKQTQLTQMHQKYNQIVQIHQSYIREAMEKHLLIEENQVLFKEHKKKKDLLSMIQESRKKIKVIESSIHSTLCNLFSEVENLKRQNQQKNQKVSVMETELQKLQKAIQETTSKSGQNIFKTISSHLAIRNIQTLLKTRKEKLNNSGIFIQNQKQPRSQSLNSSFDHSHSLSASLKPKFKIKPFMLQKDKLQHSLSKDSKEKQIVVDNYGTQKKKRVLNWRRQHTKKSSLEGSQLLQSLPKKEMFIQQSKQLAQRNPEVLAQMVEQIQIPVQE